MPNWTYNTIHMEGIAELPLFAEEVGVKNFDFNKIIPMPESLNIAAGSMEDECIIYYLTERCTVPISCLPSLWKDLLQRLLGGRRSLDSYLDALFCRTMEQAFRKESDAERDKMYQDGETYTTNYRRYGAKTWYEWCSKHWGTKWNACDTEIISRDEISFNTAWAAPTPILEKLSKMYPDVKIEHRWVDEDGDEGEVAVYPEAQYSRELGMCLAPEG